MKVERVQDYCLQEQIVLIQAVGKQQSSRWMPGL